MVKVAFGTHDVDGNWRMVRWQLARLEIMATDTDDEDAMKFEDVS